MPIKQSAIKALRQNKKRVVKNAAEKSRLYGLIRKSRKALAEKAGDVTALVQQAAKALDKAVAHGVLKRNTAARLKSRLMRKRPQ